MMLKKWFFSFLILSGVTSCGPQEKLEAISLNNKGIEALKKDNSNQAQKEFIEGLARAPFEPSLHNNLGVALDANKEVEKAIKSYETAESHAQDARNQFAARFNLGQAVAKQGKIDEALQWYQKALEIDPTSIETKTNIELLTNRQSQQGGGQGQNQNQKDKNQDQSDGDQQKEKDREKGYQQSQKYKPREFKGELSEADVKKILGELKQQEQRIRADYNKKEAKEAPREKDW